MRILYFSQFYPPESIAPAFRAAEHAKAWSETGHDVTVFTSWPNYPTGRLFDGFEMIRLGEEFVDGVRVLRSASAILPNTSFANRIKSGVSFIVNGWRNCMPKGSPVGSDYDVVLASSGTVFAAWLGARYARHKGIPLVMEFRDLTWRQMVATGGSENDPKVRVMRALELGLCSKAARVVALTEGFRKELASQGVPESKLLVVPNGADLVPCEHDWDGSLRLGYFGTMGISQDVPRTLDLAAGLYREGLLESYTLIGEGAGRASVESVLASGTYQFAKLEHGMPKDALEPRYGQVHMTVVSLQRNSSFSETIPSKIFQSLARGTPVLFVGPEGEAASLVRESGGGLALCGDDVTNANELRAFAASEGLAGRLAEMGAHATAFMERNFTRKILAERMLNVLEDAAQSRRRG